MSKVSTPQKLSAPKTLRGIYVRELTCTTPSLTFTPLDGGQKLSSETSVIGQRLADCVDEHQRPGILYLTRFRFEYRKISLDKVVATDADELVTEIEAEIACEWLDLPSDFHQAQREDFGAHSVIRICWPYWRELLHGTLARMSLPVVITPPLMLSFAEPAPAVNDKTPRKTPSHLEE